MCDSMADELKSEKLYFQALYLEVAQLLFFLTSSSFSSNIPRRLSGTSSFRPAWENGSMGM